MSVSPSAQVGPSLSSQLGSVRVGLREDLDVTRHLFRGDVHYIVRDPMTFQSQRLTLANYEVFIRIESNRSLGEVFEGLVGDGHMSAGDEDRFYRFVMSLHRLGFLRLPISDDKQLYRRYLTRERARRREKLMGFLFLRVPLWSPSAFLDRTIHLARPLFSCWFFMLWALTVLAACYVAATQWREMVGPIQGVLVARNLPLVWVTLIALKVLHEFGHAYACRHYGGHVPEMGVFLILFTPCAYVDASASWGFTHRRERLVVCLAGMYVESLIAALAVFVWAAADPGFVRSLAFNVILLAGVVTIAFNINPLMRFDGYYILSDLTEIPNLRKRSTQYVLSLLKRWLLGVEDAADLGGLRLRLTLLAYGVAATLYRFFLVIAIAAILVSKVFLVGLVFGAIYLGGMFFSVVRRITGYLWYDAETAPRRARAVAVSLLVLLIIPLGLVSIPIPSSVNVRALLVRTDETVVRAKEWGFLDRLGVSLGDRISEGHVLAEISNDVRREALLQAEADLAGSALTVDAHRVRQPVRMLQAEAKAKVVLHEWEEAVLRVGDLAPATPLDGVVVDCLAPEEIGSFIAEGTPIATVASGLWRVRAILTQEQLSLAHPQVGEMVIFRAASSPSIILPGIISRISPAGSRIVELASLTHLAGGDIAVDPLTHEAAEPYFEVHVNLCGLDPPHLRYGMSGMVDFGGRSETVAKSVGRRVARFFNRLRQGA